MNEIIKHSTDLFHEIDDCITNLIKARLDKNAENENEAIWNMERLMTNTMQHISWLVGELKGNSHINWQTGEPTRAGRYLIQTKDDGLQIALWSTFIQTWSLYSKSEIAHLFNSIQDD